MWIRDGTIEREWERERGEREGGEREGEREGGERGGERDRVTKC